MNSMYDKATTEQLIDRLNKISADDKPLWGKMNAAQMMAHCAATMHVVNGNSTVRRPFIGYILGPMLKKQFYNDLPFRKNSPTAPEFIFPETSDLEAARADLINQIRIFQQNGPDKCTKNPHAFFGKLTPEQWGKGMYKHTDHHLQQFGV